MRAVKRPLAVLGLVLVGLALRAYAVVAPHLGVISATTGTAKNQATTAVPFTIPAGANVLIDCRDAATNKVAANAYMRWTDSSSTSQATATASIMASLVRTTAGNSKYIYLSILCVDASCDCHVSQESP